jgi:hypothetical protein
MHPSFKGQTVDSAAAHIRDLVRANLRDSGDVYISKAGFVATRFVHYLDPTTTRYKLSIDATTVHRHLFVSALEQGQPDSESGGMTRLAEDAIWLALQHREADGPDATAGVMSRRFTEEETDET